MKTIGIIGGVAWPSSLVYYRKINEFIAQKLGGIHCAKLVLVQTDFELVERYQRENRWDELGVLLSELGVSLKNAGADFFLIACNTVHTSAHVVEKSVDLPFIHIVDPTAEQIISQGFKKVGLLGSRYTMNGDYFVKRLEKQYGLDVLIAEGQYQENVHNALYQELVKGVFVDETRGKFKHAIEDLANRGAQVIVLGCTEFGMLVSAEDSPIPIIDTTIAHINAAVDTALGI